MNDTPQGDGNLFELEALVVFYSSIIRMNDTPQGDGNIPLNKFIILSFFSIDKNE